MEIAVLRLVHILFGILWVGGAVTVGWFVVPSVNEAGPAGGAVMNGIVAKRKFPQAMSLFGLLTIVSGARLYMLKVFGANGFNSAWLMTPEGIVLTLGGLLAVAGFFIGVFVQRPIAMRLQALGGEIAAGGGPPNPAQVEELGALKSRMQKLGLVLAGHLGAAALLMASMRLAQTLSVYM